ncbi:MAG: wax ester/triacylglycerol synthase family O-acyltransferase [bacterium]|nr:wax ester/triacylglycerol synthase family O-acyltransferase [Deltaproteobacteria bacterium]MCP4908750.1 wax ester/triacylglycerol synthase family O-acyltransferase [bacterium]
MSTAHYERLTAMDTSFLVLEKPWSPLHVSATLIYEAGPMANADGGIDITAYRKATESVLHLIPRYRQKLQWIPVVGHPVWVDDPEFNLEYHVRHTSLPRPGTDEQLKKLSARIMAQPLDHSKPLWEAWLVEGLEGDRFAVISKIHHCMVDGMAGKDLAQILHSTDPRETEREKAPVWAPRKAPSPTRLLTDELGRYVGLPRRAARGMRDAMNELYELREEVVTRVRSVADMMSSMREEPSKTPLNEAIGPHRRFDWRDMPLEDVKKVRRALGCTINDVVLATVTGAVRRFLQARGHELEGVDFRIAAPVSIRSSDDRDMGNRVSQWFVRAPLDESDPRARVQKIQAATEELKASKQALDADLIMNIAEWTPTILLSLASRSASGSAPYNMMVTNVPGPQQALYLLGARLESLYSQVPIADSTALGVALVSYAGKLCWGFNADFESVPDLELFADAIEGSFLEIAEAACVTFDGPCDGGESPS